MTTPETSNPTAVNSALQITDQAIFSVRTVAISAPKPGFASSRRSRRGRALDRRRTSLQAHWPCSSRFVGIRRSTSCPARCPPTAPCSSRCACVAVRLHVPATKQFHGSFGKPIVFDIRGSSPKVVVQWALSISGRVANLRTAFAHNRRSHAAIMTRQHCAACQPRTVQCSGSVDRRGSGSLRDSPRPRAA